MTDAVSSERNVRGEWRPADPISLAPINAWPPRPTATFKWLFGFPGYLWPQNAFWLGITLFTWAFLTPELSAMKSFELWWIALLFARNLAFILVLFGGLHLYFYVFKGQGDALRFTTKPFATNSRRFLFKDQVRDNMFRALMYGVPVITGYEAVTYWAFANGYLGLFDFGGDQALFWTWFALLLLVAPVIHAVHFYFAHRLLHVKPLYKTVHFLHHRYFECNYGGSLAPLDKLFGIFHDGSEAAHAAMRERLRARREALS